MAELTAGVTRRTAAIVLAGALAGAWLGGPPGALGVLAGGALGLVSFRMLAARAAAAAPSPAPAAPWVVLAGVRLVAVSGAAAALFVTGLAHPVAWLAGYTALPLAVVLQGLRVARAERRP